MANTGYLLQFFLCRFQSLCSCHTIFGVSSVLVFDLFDGLPALLVRLVQELFFERCKFFAVHLLQLGFLGLLSFSHGLQLLLQVGDFPAEGRVVAL